MEEKVERPIIGKYGLYGDKKLEYMKRWQPQLYVHLVARGQLEQYLLDLDQEVAEKISDLTEELGKQQGATFQLRKENPLLWAGIMTNCKHQAREIVLNELVYN